MVSFSFTMLFFICSDHSERTLVATQVILNSHRSCFYKWNFFVAIHLREAKLVIQKSQHKNVSILIYQRLLASTSLDISIYFFNWKSLKMREQQVM